ncbi:MAG: winged helix-turn-helix domain-containing protein [Gemmatimonadaceae bacterium]
MPRVGREAVADALRSRIVTGLHVGRYAGGEKLPPMRALATEFDVNERVILAALRALESEGFVSLRPRSGAYVTPPHPASGESLPDLGQWLVTVLVQARTRGLPPRDLPDYLRRCLETRRIRAACIECNEDSRHLLCSELESDHGLTVESVAVDDLGAARVSGLMRSDLLVTTNFHAAAVQREAKRLKKPWLAVALRRDVFDDIARRLEHGPVYYVATDPKFRSKLRSMFSSPRLGRNLRMVLVDRDDLDVIPPNAPTFVTSRAREQLKGRYGAGGGPGVPIHPPRLLSDASAQELLTFMVRANMASLAAGLR